MAFGHKQIFCFGFSDPADCLDQDAGGGVLYLRHLFHPQLHQCTCSTDRATLSSGRTIRKHVITHTWHWQPGVFCCQQFGQFLCVLLDVFQVQKGAATSVPRKESYPVTSLCDSPVLCTIFHFAELSETSQFERFC